MKVSVSYSFSCYLSYILTATSVTFFMIKNRDRHSLSLFSNERTHKCQNDWVSAGSPYVSEIEGMNWCHVRYVLPFLPLAEQFYNSNRSAHSFHNSVAVSIKFWKALCDFFSADDPSYCILPSRKSQLLSTWQTSPAELINIKAGSWNKLTKVAIKSK